MKIKVFVAIIFLLIPTFSMANFGMITKEKVFKNTNMVREILNIETLSYNILLEEAAQKKAEDMAAKGYLEHTCPEGNKVWKTIRETNYDFRYAGENLAGDFNNPIRMLLAWINSPTHLKNIINKKFKETGVGIAIGKYEGKEIIFVVQLFGTKK